MFDIIQPRCCCCRGVGFDSSRQQTADSRQRTADREQLRCCICIKWTKLSAEKAAEMILSQLSLSMPMKAINFGQLSSRFAAMRRRRRRRRQRRRLPQHSCRLLLELPMMLTPLNSLRSLRSLRSGPCGQAARLAGREIYEQHVSAFSRAS